MRGGEAAEAIQGLPATPGLLRSARNDGSRFLDESEDLALGGDSRDLVRREAKREPEALLGPRVANQLRNLTAMLSAMERATIGNRRLAIQTFPGRVLVK